VKHLDGSTVPCLEQVLGSLIQLRCVLYYVVNMRNELFVQRL
jgi:hypothetical protein